jgi:outer membrane protein OmpA-like peptidoglycan-associated protein
LPGVETVLDAFAESLKKMPDVKIELQGHICCHGKQGDGLDIETGMENLSVMRAKEVHDYLIAKGVDKKRLVYKGLGNNFPKVWPEMSNADQVANRRVEAVIWE